MRFEHTTDQRDFARSLDKLVAGSDPIAVARAWAEGDHAAGLTLWARLAEQGVTMLATEASPVEVCVAFEVLGRHSVPGPWVESAAYLPVALGREVAGVATVAVPPHTPYALDADVAEAVYLDSGRGEPTLVPPERRASEPVVSVDPTRRLFRVGEAVDVAGVSGSRAFDLAALATAAQLLGLGERVLADSVTYVTQRRQFGREIGSYQAIKHQLANVRIALDFAQPLVYGAAVALSEPAGTAERSVSAAKVQAAEAAYLASRVGLQVHGAIGYTREHDLSVFLTRIRALVTAWGTPAFHRSRILDSLLGERIGSA
ncbi:hypothetical protein KUV85_04305 [Nocardioides panacisoli]|uniref:acyl-CoA dehydrogenase n=1 Tax=Nocardioides panacisoli TaxID=627624 RepID=UPI001C62D65D|nr:acyl-CoA dehydrogenase [Nocardioides panacisoli]QYJ04917.1 hypothetical protein KUV85_04305 [Nocardioides panacisoli]